MKSLLFAALLVVFVSVVIFSFVSAEGEAEDSASINKRQWYTASPYRYTTPYSRYG